MKKKKRTGLCKNLSLILLACMLMMSVACAEKKPEGPIIPQASEMGTEESRESIQETEPESEPQNSQEDIQETSMENQKEESSAEIPETPESDTAGETQPTGELQATEELSSAPEASMPSEPEDEVMKILSGMSLREKVCQMLIVTPEECTGKKGVTKVASDFANRYKEYPVGGIIFFGPNLQNKEQVITMLADFQKNAKEVIGLPMLLCVDEEGGRVAQVANIEAFGLENVGFAAYRTTEEEAREAGKTIGGYLYELGFNVDFAPVADTITNPENVIIGERSFGSDPQVVADFASAFSEGLREKKILSTFKHFPDHGATEGDTHEGFAYTGKSLEELKKAELIPFYRANEAADFVMVAHISLPGILGDNTPCTLSKKVITDILKGELGYEGLVITDAMNMGAITKNYKSKDACVKAVQAGNDLILMPLRLVDACDAIVDAVERGEIPESRIDESVEKILRVKLNKLQ